ncbi:YrdB family protein [Antrihabitans cavernicola]|uniref:DUF2568 domain-containing protein n=1 Tax=Antrihabitans cavernicola TaxID=2495913 RepID=A0A5A7S6A7_9NOCA|nr:YrdB family protein [Spelaeibacter cavernicola]KAA0019416.1 DUF2568 domain-containing protein [Spelaeibacter cavernicola]
MTPRPESRTTTPGPLDVVAFACEMAMLVLLAIAGWRLFDATPAKVIALIVLPVAAGVVWGIWMAPTSTRRLANPARLLVQTVLFATTAVICVAAGMPWWGIGFAVVAIGVFGMLSRGRS